MYKINKCTSSSLGSVVPKSTIYLKKYFKNEIHIDINVIYINLYYTYTYRHLHRSLLK